MSFTEKKIDGKTVYDGKILKLCVDNVELYYGKTAGRECVRHSGGAAVLLVDGGKVLLVKQFRYLYGKEIYEIPAGKLNEGEDPEIAAARELEEETGYKASLLHAFDLFPSPGYTDEIIHVYFAEKFEKTQSHPDEGEYLNCEFKPVGEVLKMIESGEICDAKTVAAVYRFTADKK